MEDNWRPNLEEEGVLLGLAPRDAPYFNIIQYCRHIGLHVRPDQHAYWVARVRTKTGTYRQKRLCLAVKNGNLIADFEKALGLATDWFSTSEIASLSAEPYQLGSKRHLNICPIGAVYTVGHALHDYLEWKTLAATKSHFETLVSLANYHLVPRIACIPLADFDGTDFHALALDVLETPPKFGREKPRHRLNIRDMTQSELRKRKKTFNSLVSILRGAFEIAWERGHLESDVPMRCLRRLPNVDRPRIVFLDQEERERLVEACDGDLRLLVRAALFTGCRANELISLKVRDFNADAGTLFVSSPKGRRTRHVLLPSAAVEFFTELTMGKPGSEHMFRKANGRVWGSEYKSYFQRARAKANLLQEVTFHGLRHTYASKLLEGGASLITVADQLGHANTQTVSTTYGHLTTGRQREEIERSFGGTPDENRRKSSVPVFRHQPDTSWPRANHSRYSGGLLKLLRHGARTSESDGAKSSAGARSRAQLKCRCSIRRSQG